MALFEILLKLTHDSPFLEISRSFPSVKMFFWCNGEHDIIEMVVGNLEDYPLVMERIRKTGACAKVVEESTDLTKIYLIIQKCACTRQNSVDVHIGTLNLLHVFPVVMEKGWEFHRIIAFQHEDLEELLQRIEEESWAFEILRKMPFDGFIASSLTLTADALFSDLTQKQIDALLTAHRHGYYIRPRKAGVQTIAAKQQIPRTTFQEHLKKAENKLVISLVPYIHLYNCMPLKRRERLKTNQSGSPLAT
jgi:predicted DNA binding protein